MAALVDTNILVYRFDRRFPEKQRIATQLLRDGIRDDSVRVPNQAIVEFVAAVTRPLDDGEALLTPKDARRGRLPAPPVRCPPLGLRRALRSFGDPV